MTIAERFQISPFHRELGATLEAADAEGARVRIPYRDEIANPGGALHGGVMASAIDIAGAAAADAGYDLSDDAERSTLDLSVNYLAAALREDIIASAEVLRRGKEIAYSRVDVRTAAGKRIATGLVTRRCFDANAVPAARERQSHAAAVLPPAEGHQRIRNAEMFVSFGFIAHLGIAVSHAHSGEAILTMPVKREVTGDGQVVHEGALAALIDTTGALASWSIVGLNMAHKASTVGLHVSYHAPGADELVAHARTRRRNNEIFLNEVEVSEARSRRVVAAGSVTYRIVVSD